MEQNIENLSRLPCFAKFHPFESMTYLGEVKPKILAFKGIRPDITSYLFLKTVIAKEERLVWHACREMLAQAVKLASGIVKGIFGYELLTVDLTRGLENFNPSDFSKLLANHAQKMEAGDSRLIQYGAFWGFFTKRVPEDWGKIDFKTHVEIYPKDPAELDLFLKKAVRNCRDSGIPKESERILVIGNPGTTPLVRFEDEAQAIRLKQFWDALRHCDDGGPFIFYVWRDEKLWPLGVSTE